MIDKLQRVNDRVFADAIGDASLSKIVYILNESCWYVMSSSKTAYVLVRRYSEYGPVRSQLEQYMGFISQASELYLEPVSDTYSLARLIERQSLLVGDVVLEADESQLNLPEGVFSDRYTEFYTRLGKLPPRVYFHRLIGPSLNSTQEGKLLIDWICSVYKTIESNCEVLIHN